MKPRQELSETSSGEQLARLTDGFTIYDVPGANLDARGILRPLLKHNDPDVSKAAERAIDLLTKSIRAMGKDDIELLMPG